jgi:hypothetical protein
MSAMSMIGPETQTDVTIGVPKIFAHVEVPRRTTLELQRLQPISMHTHFLGNRGRCQNTEMITVKEKFYYMVAILIKRIKSLVFIFVVQHK